MVISIFKPPEDGKTWAEQKTGDICDCISYEYEKIFNGVGTFTAEVPVNTRFRDELLVNRFLVTDSGDALIIKNIQTTLEKIKITGYDLNGLLCDRVTLGTDDSGYDPASGTTEACVKYYVRNNLSESSVAERNLPRFGVAESLGRGVTDDHAYPRYQNLQEIVTEMCGAAGLGWRVSIDSKSGGDKPIFVFDVYEQTDRSANQSERDRVIFSVQTHNISSMTREIGVTAAKNTLYLDIDGTIVQYPKNPAEGEETAGRQPGSGYERREEYCSLSGTSLDESIYKVEAEQNMADRMEETDSLTIEAGSPLDYGVRYDTGTIVTVYDRGRTLQLDSVISAVSIKRTGTEYSVKLTLGESKPKLLDQYAKKSGVTQRTVRNDGGKMIVNTDALSEYQYLTDDSVKCNGVTYAVEKDADTGLISKISDSNGNSLNPEIPSRITDVALHNAVFWAVAMARGLGSPDPAEELIKSAIYRLYEPDGTIYMTNYVDTGIPQSRLTSSETGVTVAFVLKPSAWAPYYGLWGQHSGNDGQNIQCTKNPGGNSAHLYRHNIGFDLTAGEKYVLIISDQRNTADCYVMKNTVEITKGTPSESTSSAFGNVVLYNSYQFEEQRNYHGIAYDALIWDKALTRSEALAVAKRLMAQHNITGGNT